MAKWIFVKMNIVMQKWSWIDDRVSYRYRDIKFLFIYFPYYILHPNRSEGIWRLCSHVIVW